MSLLRPFFASCVKRQVCCSYQHVPTKPLPRQQLQSVIWNGFDALRFVKTKPEFGSLFQSNRVKSALQPVANRHVRSVATVTQPAPYFEGKAVVDCDIQDLSSGDYAGKYWVLFFYPLDFTFVCPTEIIAFSDRYCDFEKLNTGLIAASVDSHFSHLAWVKTPRNEGGLGRLQIPLLSDITKSISRDYGVLLENTGFALRGLFIVDAQGIVRHISINDTGVGRNVDEVLRLVQAFQFADKHGEVCPASWKPGEKAIKPGVKESKEYFQSTYGS